MGLLVSPRRLEGRGAEGRGCLGRELWLSLQVQHGSQTFLVKKGKLGVPFESLQGNQALSRVERVFGVLSTCDINLGVPLELQ